MKCLMVLVLICAALGVTGCADYTLVILAMVPITGPGRITARSVLRRGSVMSRSAIGRIISRWRVIGRQQVLRLEARPLGMAEWSKVLDPRPLRRAGILIGAGFTGAAIDA